MRLHNEKLNEPVKTKSKNKAFFDMVQNSEQAFEYIKSIQAPTKHQALVVEVLFLILQNRVVESPWKELQKMQIEQLVKMC